MPTTSAGGFQIIAEWAGHKTDIRINSDKIWASAYTDNGTYLCVWGRRGTAYREQSKHFGSQRAAAAWFDAKVAEKVRKGYDAVRFGDRRHGNIPSFGSAVAGTVTGGAGPRITLAGVLAELAAVPRALGRARGDLPEVIFAFAQTRLKAELLLDHAPLDGDDRTVLAAALAGARSAVQQALVA
ncbi:MAG: WGR domain-containing protein [Chloroflexi bacterium]|nr:WGR domain-containing protein [Chloroflexota bacterium]